MSDSPEGVAIVGMAARVPGAGSVEEFWRNLRDGVESIRFFSDEELKGAGVADAVLRNPGYVRARGVLDGIELFDAGLFGFSPREAEVMDPQHRLFLEAAWEALENAGYDAETYAGRVGVYAGGGMSNYLLFNLISNPELIASAGDFQLLLGNDKDYLATRVSYKLNLKGPSVAVQASCSSSLVAVHLACQALLGYEADMALAGGVSIGVRQTAGYVYQEGGILSPDGHCRAFDAAAAGTVGGSGLGVVVLKRLEDALAERDTIHAVIKGSAVNNDGALKVGYTAPSVNGQAEVIAEALAAAGVGPDGISYVEAHGTGTTLGDPIEVAALKKVFEAATKRKGFCAIGSVKTNLGHLDTAAGVVGLMKTVLSLKHGQLPPSLHFTRPNPQAGIEGSPFYVNAELAPWEANGAPRRAGVSSFGIGGTNAHVIVEEAPARPDEEESDAPQLLVLSARSDAALEQATANLLEHLRRRESRLADVAYTLQVGRKAFNRRRALVCRDTDDAAAKLGAAGRAAVMSGAAESGRRPVAFMFSGQGSQYVNMGRDLYRGEAVFREEVDRCASSLRPHLGFDLRGLLYPDAADEGAEERLTQTALTQPALFVVEYALARLWMSWGVRPEALIGHSLGEYVAACLSGVLTPEDALALVAARGRLMQQVPAGEMLSVSLPEEELLPLLAGTRLSLAAVNGPALCAVSGAAEEVRSFERRLEERGLTCRRLHTSHAFHSEMMEPVLAPFAEEVGKVTLRAPEIPYVSNLTGTWIREEEARDPAYWAAHLRRTVRFSAGVGELLGDGRRALLEVGPGQTLSTFARQHAEAKGRPVLRSLRHAQEQRPDDLSVRETLGRLWLAGVEVDWRGLHGGEPRRRVPLPAYPFERQRYWVEPQEWDGAPRAGRAPLEKKADIAEWFYVPSWKQSHRPAPPAGPDLSGETLNWLVFLDGEGLGERVASELEARRQHVVGVRAGGEFAAHGDGSYTINPRSRADYDALFQALAAGGFHPERIVHLWSVTGPPAGGEDGRFEECQGAGFYSLLFLAQALDRQHVSDPVRVGVVSSDMQEVTGRDQLWPEKATLLGPCKVIPQEYLNVTCQSIDVEAPADERARVRTAARIVGELSGAAEHPVVAYRAHRRWVLGFEPARLEAVPDEAVRLRERGVYLITGGLGDIGLTLTEYLARTVRARLVLVGRTKFPGRDEWDAWARGRGGRDPVGAKIEKLRAAESHGAEILILEADVASEPQMRAAFERAEEHFGAVHGVFHAAGAVGPGSFRAVQELSVADCERQFRAKAHGVQVLEKVLAGRPPDFCLLQSSLAAVLGGLGYFAYSAANLYMDAFARRHNRDDARPWLSVNWDGWRLNDEAGQGEGDASTLAQLTIAAGEGMEAVRRILSGGVDSQVVVSTGDLQARIEQWIDLVSARGDGGGAQGQSLLLHARPDLPNDYAAPRNEYERQVVAIWQELLGIEPVGVHDNFFDLGGHSLLGTQLVSRLRQTFHVEVALRSIFEQPTAAELAGVIEEGVAARDARPAADAHAAEAITPRRSEGPAPLSFAQERLWFLHQLEPDSTAYNIFFALRLGGRLDVAALEQSLTEVVRRHEALRTTFALSEGGPAQVIHPPEPVRLPAEDLSDLPADERERAARREATAEARRPFDLAAGPLLRARLLRLGEEEHVLLVTMHHIVSDGWSMGVLVREAGALYEAYRKGEPSPLEELAVQYADYAVWQRARLRGEVLESQLSYWREQLAGAPQALELPTDRPRPAVQTYRGATEAFELGADLSARLRELSRAEGVTLFMTLLAAFQTLLHRYTGQKDILVNTSIANRNYAETEALIGFFINQLILRADMSGNPTFRCLLRQVRETTLNAYDNQDVPYEKVLEEVQPDRDAGRAPLTQVLFVLQNAPAEALELSGLTLDTLDVGSETAKLDLILAMEERPRGLGGTFEYNTDLFDASTVTAMAGHFTKLLDEFTLNPDWRVLDVPLSERRAEPPAGVAARAQEKFADDQFTF